MHARMNAGIRYQKGRIGRPRKIGGRHVRKEKAALVDEGPGRQGRFTSTRATRPEGLLRARPHRDREAAVQGSRSEVRPARPGQLGARDAACQLLTQGRARCFDIRADVQGDDRRHGGTARSLRLGVRAPTRRARPDSRTHRGTHAKRLDVPPAKPRCENGRGKSTLRQTLGWTTGRTWPPSLSRYIATVPSTGKTECRGPEEATGCSVSCEDVSSAHCFRLRSEIKKKHSRNTPGQIAATIPSPLIDQIVSKNGLKTTLLTYTPQPCWRNPC